MAAPGAAALVGGRTGEVVGVPLVVERTQDREGSAWQDVALVVGSRPPLEPM